MSFNSNQPRKFQNNNKQPPKYFLSSNKNFQNNNSNSSKYQKRAISQKKYMPPDIITQVPSSNLYLNNIYSSNNLNLNYMHQQAFTPINRRKKLYEDDFLIPAKSPKFKGKKTLVLDLDETLVHSSFIPFEKNDLILNVNFDGIFYNIYVLVRPGVEQFIKEMGKYFEIVTFTASIETYASPLLDLLDKEKNIQYRLYRDHCNFVNGIFIKDLKRLNRNLKDIIIIDNSPMAYAFDVENGLPILSWFDNRDDRELINIQKILKFLANVDDVRKYIKKILRNNCINYDIANTIIKQYGVKKQNKKEGSNNNIKVNDSGFEEEKGDSNNNNKNIGNGIDKKKKNSNKIKNLKANNDNNLYNNFIIKNDMNNIQNLINGDVKMNNFNNLKKLENKINNLTTEKKILKLKLQNHNNSLGKSFELDKKNSLQLKKNNSKIKKQEKRNLFRFGLLKDNTNNISPINNNVNVQSKLVNIENDIKLNDNIIMPKIFSQNVKISKSSTFQLNQNNKKNIDKNKQIKTNNYFLNSNHKSIEPISLKKNLNYDINSSSQIKYLNLMEKFQESTSKSSSLNVNNNMKSNIKINNNLKSAKYKINNSVNNKKNKIGMKNRLRLSSKPINNLNNNNIDLNFLDKNKMTDIYTHVLRSKSTGSFIKLQSAHPKTPKTTSNNILNSNLNSINYINKEDNKINNNFS